MARLVIRKDVAEEMIEKGIIRDFSDKVEKIIHYFRHGTPVTRKQWVKVQKRGKGIHRSPFRKDRELPKETIKTQEERIKQLNYAPIIKGIQPLKVNIFNYETIANKNIDQIQRNLQKDKPYCKAIGKNVVNLNKKHLLHPKGNIRDWEDLKNHVPYIPFIQDLIKVGKLNKNIKSLPSGTYELLSRANIDTKFGRKRIGLAMHLSENDNGVEVTEITIFNVIDNRTDKRINGVIKSMTSLDCAISDIAQDEKSKSLSYYIDSQHRHNSNIAQGNNLSSKKVIKSIVPDYAGENRKGKTFDIQITDITENNKQQKLEQFNKALNAIADKKPFMIKHIPADNSEHYENLTVRLMDFDRSKIEKAVHKVALSLDADVLASSKGESFVYESQKEITERFYKKVTDSARAVYNFVISYFDLPDIRIISKAGELKHKGKILYNPETGKPIKESEWKKFIVELEKFLNRNYSGVGEKIVLSAESLGIILDRLSKTNSLEAIRKMSLSTLKTKRYDVDWVSESIKNMKDKFGDVISRERQARIQIAMDSAAQRVTRVKDDMRNNIQQIIIDGIRDKQSKSVVAQNLFDKCASLNRDMQRIADSEVQMAANSSYCKEEVYNSKPGEKVYFKRFEMMDDNTCKACKKLNGTIALWSDVPLPDEHIKDTYAKYAIWEGKNEGSCPIGIVHPYCRGTWTRYYPDLD